MLAGRYGLVALSLVALAGCKPATEANAPKVDTAAEESAIRAKETAWMAAYNAHDAAALTGQYEDDATIASNGVALMTDAAARKAFLDGFAADPALKVDFASDRIIVAKSGELASSRGHYSFTYTDPATKQPKTETGSYLTVYRKAADGSWKAAEDFTTPGPAAAPAAAAQ
jgi:ketosteroid isomerase-like protein